MSGDELNKFIELFDKISKLKSVKCRMAHERVRIDKETGLPVVQTMPESSYKRIGLCSPEIRGEMLSCGHTMARYLLQDALELLNSEGKDTVIFEAELTDLINRIHILDHEKGEAEKRLAKLIEKKHFQTETNLTSDFETTNAEIQNIEWRHDEFVERMSSLRDLIIFEMKAVIECAKTLQIIQMRIEGFSTLK